ncbi:MAG: hypothetical protein AAF517_28005, partial [Planctomycetota bacterium]
MSTIDRRETGSVCLCRARLVEAERHGNVCEESVQPERLSSGRVPVSSPNGIRVKSRADRQVA